MFGEVQSCGFNLGRDTEADRCFDDVSNDRSADDSQHQGQGNRFDLLEHKWLEEGVGYSILQVSGEVRIGCVARQTTCKERTQSSADGVDPEGIQSVGVTEPGLYFPAEEPGDN